MMPSVGIKINLPLVIGTGTSLLEADDLHDVEKDGADCVGRFRVDVL